MYPHPIPLLSTAAGRAARPTLPPMGRVKSAVLCDGEGHPNRSPPANAFATHPSVYSPTLPHTHPHQPICKCISHTLPCIHSPHSHPPKRRLPHLRLRTPDGGSVLRTGGGRGAVTGPGVSDQRPGQLGAERADARGHRGAGEQEEERNGCVF